MSANIDKSTQKNIAMIVANPSISPVTNWPIGFWWSELTHPYWEFIENGYNVEIFSPEGGDLVADGYSDPEDASGYSAHDILSLGFKKSESHSNLLKNTKSIKEIDVNKFDAVFFVGGQSPMITFKDNVGLQKLVANFYENNKFAVLVCHSTCLLLTTHKSDGTLLVEGKTWTGFADSEEKFADNFVGFKIQPYWIEEEAKKLSNTNFITNGMFKPFAVRDGYLITGQQQFSGSAAAKLLISSIGI